MIIKGIVYDQVVYINIEKIDYFYEDGFDSKVVIGETVFLVKMSIEELTTMIKG